MSFTTPCFIRKNTLELRQKLEDMGYKRYRVRPDGRNLRNTFSNSYTAFSWMEPIATDERFINCDSNESLFLALSALRDDSDYMQWFWYKGCLFLCRGTGSTICMDGSYSLRIIRGNGFFEIMNHECRKATAEELIEHFKTKEQ